MLWATWPNTPLVSSLALCSIVVLLRVIEPQIAQLNVLSALAFASLVISIAPEHSATVLATLPGIAAAIINDYHLAGFFFSNVSMLFTGAATVWLLRRAFQTLWKPVPELIDILGVDVPTPPDVSLTAIGVDKATITWTRPPSNRAVDKYVIQVNGVNVGESATSHDTFITVSGLKPNHFYNVRIIAVGSNNFQAGSRVLRLRTFGSDGRPRLGTSRLPSDFTDDDAASASRQHDAAGGGDETGSIKQFVTSTFGVAQPLPSDGPQALSREGASSGGLAPSSSRRNTVNRRHSPSTTSLDQQQQLQHPQQFNAAATTAGADEEAEVTEAQMAELNQRYLNLRKETEEIAAMCAKEEEEMKKQLDELEAEKQAKRKEQKRKEEQTEKLKREQGATDRAMRAAISRRAQKEKRLKEKIAELDRLHDDIETWDGRIKDMAEEQLTYNKQRTELDEEYQEKAASLRENNKAAQEESLRLEVELKHKRQLVKALEDERTTLASNGDDSGLRAEIVGLKRQLQRMENDQRSHLSHENRRKEGLDAHILILSAQIQQIPQSNFGTFNNASASPPVFPNTAAHSALPSTAGLFDFDPATSSHAKRRSHASNSLSSAPVSSPIPAFAHAESSGLTPSSTPSFVGAARPPTQSGFLTGPFMGSSADHPGPEDAGLRVLTAGAPLSPSATSLLPSNIFADDEPPSPSLNIRAPSPFVPMDPEFPDVLGSLNSFTNSNRAPDSNSSHGSQDNGASNIASLNININTTSTTNATPEPTAMTTSASGPQSPASSHRSRSILSSPRESSQNLPFSAYGIDGVDGRPPTGSTLPSPIVDPATLSGQPSNSTRFNLFSFQRSRVPKALDEVGPALGTLKHGQSQSFPRQGDDAEGNKNRRISLSAWNVFNRNSAGPELVESQFTPPAHLNKGGVFSARSLFPFGSRTGNIFADRDPSSPRPASMASIDMPRPSTDSSSIWGPPGDNNASNSALAKASRLWPPDNAWPSRNPSRRPSIHGSPSALKTNLASADDEILDEEELLNPETSPSQVGVIGSRPHAASKVNKTLNPAAPTFMANIFRPKSDKDSKERDKSKGKDKGKDKSKGRDKDKARDLKGGDRGETPAPDTPAGSGLPNLIIEESPSNSRLSRDGLSVHTQASLVSVSESRNSLDYVVSNTTSEPNSLGMLSSSKDSGEHALLKLFRKESSGKLSFPRRIGRSKGPGSMASSDKNMSAEHRSSFGDFEDLADEPALSTSSSRRTGMSMGMPLATSNSVGGAESVTGSPSLGPLKSRDKSEGKLKGTGWFSMKKKNREKESLDIDRDRGRGLGEPDSTVSSLVTTASATTDDGDKKAA